MRNTTKVLCHLDGGPFCVYNKTGNAYAMYFSDATKPPAPESLHIEHGSVTDPYDWFWRPVVQVIGEPVEDVEVYGEYDEDGQTL